MGLLSTGHWLYALNCTVETCQAWLDEDGEIKGI